MEDKIVCGLVKGGKPRIIYCEIDANIINDVKSEKFSVEVLPNPLCNIVLVWKNEGYENFALKLPANGWEMSGGMIEPKSEIKYITGDALFLRCDGDDHNGLEQEDYRRIIDSQYLGHLYPNGYWEPFRR